MIATGLAGMTLNERLFHVGVLDHWDRAIATGDRKAMTALLAQVEVDDPDVVVDAVLTKRRTGRGAGRDTV